MFHPEGPTLCELAVQALSSTEHGYDLIAPKFDFTPFRTPDEVLAPSLVRVGPPASVGSALDVCCGTGAAMRLLRLLCRERVVGVDFSQGMLDEARRRTAQAPGTADLVFTRQDVLEMTYEAEFDLAVSFGSFGHFLPQDQPRLVSRIVRALKPGGRFLFVTVENAPNPWIWLLCRAFNAGMQIRNNVRRPPFIMYYLTFLLAEARAMLEHENCEVQVTRDLFPRPYKPLVLVEARRRA